MQGATSAVEQSTLTPVFSCYHVRIRAGCRTPVRCPSPAATAKSSARPVHLPPGWSGAALAGGTVTLCLGPASPDTAGQQCLLERAARSAAPWPAQGSFFAYRIGGMTLEQALPRGSSMCAESGEGWVSRGGQGALARPVGPLSMVFGTGFAGERVVREVTDRGGRGDPAPRSCGLESIRRNLDATGTSTCKSRLLDTFAGGVAGPVSRSPKSSWPGPSRPRWPARVRRCPMS